MSGSLYAVLLIAVVALVTAALRFLPFWVFRGDKPIPPALLQLGRILPAAAIGMLVIYCLKGVSFSSVSSCLPALLSAAAVAALQAWKHKDLLSILSGTVLYMILIRIF